MYCLVAKRNYFHTQGSDRRGKIFFEERGWPLLFNEFLIPISGELNSHFSLVYKVNVLNNIDVSLTQRDSRL